MKTYNDYLLHYGVKGMKWGIRHDPERSFKGHLYRGLSNIYDLNERTYNKMGNRTMAGMNRQAKNMYLKKADSADAAKKNKIAAKQKEKLARKKQSESVYGKVSDKKAYSKPSDFFTKAGKNVAQNYKQGTDFYSKSIKSIKNGKAREIGKHYADWLNQDVEVLGFTGSKTMKRKRFITNHYNPLF